MRSYLFTFALALTGASAASLSRRTGSGNENCCGFTLSVGGSPVEQLGDGQLRIYQTNLPNNSTFCLKNGDLTDDLGRGCVVESSSTYQIQCDTGATPTPGFSVSSSGLLEYMGSTTFYACPTGDNGGYNIYTETLQGQTCKTITVMVNGGNCVQTTTTTTVPPTTTTKPPTTTTKPPTTTAQPTCPTTTETCTVTQSNTVTETCTVTQPGGTVTVTQAGGTVTVTKGGATVTTTCTTTAYMTVTAQCTTSMAPPPPTTSQAPPPTTSAPPPTTTQKPPPSSSAPPTTTGGSKTCPTNLSGSYQYPHLIVPVNSSSPNTAYGTSYFGTVSPSISSVFNFDIPASYAGETCTVVFLFPTQAQLTTSSFQQSGSGTIEFFALSGPATQATTYNTLPGVSATLLNVNAQPGNSYVVSTGSCAAGQRIGILAKATGSYSLNYFQDYNPSPIGVYITAC